MRLKSDHIQICYKFFLPLASHQRACADSNHKPCFLLTLLCSLCIDITALSVCHRPTSHSHLPDGLIPPSLAAGLFPWSVPYATAPALRLNGRLCYCYCRQTCRREYPDPRPASRWGWPGRGSTGPVGSPDGGICSRSPTTQAHILNGCGCGYPVSFGLVLDEYLHIFSFAQMRLAEGFCCCTFSVVMHPVNILFGYFNSK